MSKLIEFLKNIEAEGILKELEEDPTTLSITGIEFVSQSSIPVGYPKIPENALKDLFNILKEDTSIKHLRADSFSWSLESIKLFAAFFKDPVCQIISISFIHALNDVSKIDILLAALEANKTVENVKLGHNYLGDKGLDKLINNLSKKSIKILELQNTNIRLENGIINNFIKFLKESNTKVLDISSNPIAQEDLIKLLESIKETNVSELDISGIFFDNDLSILGGESASV